jgi:hypothetical protein
VNDVPGGAAGHAVACLDAAGAAEHGRSLELSLDTSQIKLFEPIGGTSLIDNRTPAHRAPGRPSLSQAAYRPLHTCPSLSALSPQDGIAMAHGAIR